MAWGVTPKVNGAAAQVPVAALPPGATYGNQTGASRTGPDHFVGGSGLKTAPSYGTTPAGAAPATQPQAAPADPGGSQSGPGILEQWFNQRAGGTDPGWEYATGRATDQINRQAAARGGYNSSAATQGIDDMFANATSQRESQLDALAGGASGEHQGRLNNMFTQGMGLANGQANTSSGFDTKTGDYMNQNQIAQIQLALDKAGIDQKTQQAWLGFMQNAGSTAASIYGGGAGGYRGAGGGGS